MALWLALLPKLLLAVMLPAFVMLILPQAAPPAQSNSARIPSAGPSVRPPPEKGPAVQMLPPTALTMWIVPLLLPEVSMPAKMPTSPTGVMRPVAPSNPIWPKLVMSIVGWVPLADWNSALIPFSKATILSLLMTRLGLLSLLSRSIPSSDFDRRVAVFCVGHPVPAPRVGFGPLVNTVMLPVVCMERAAALAPPPVLVFVMSGTGYWMMPALEI